MTSTTIPPALAGVPQHICDACRTRPGTWRATFPDSVAFDLCDDCIVLVDDRVTLSRSLDTP